MPIEKVVFQLHTFAMAEQLATYHNTNRLQIDLHHLTSLSYCYSMNILALEQFHVFSNGIKGCLAGMRAKGAVTLGVTST